MRIEQTEGDHIVRSIGFLEERSGIVNDQVDSAIGVGLLGMQLVAQSLDRGIDFDGVDPYPERWLSLRSGRALTVEERRRRGERDVRF